MAGQNIPFRWIRGLPPEAQKDIERDFLAVIEQIVQAPTIFDAIIDPTLLANSPLTHQYLNLTSLLENETWSDGILNVGVKQNAHVAIIEPAATSLSGHGDLALFGISAFLPDASHLPWQWGEITFAVGQQIYMSNLSIDGITPP